MPEDTPISSPPVEPDVILSPPIENSSVNSPPSGSNESGSSNSGTTIPEIGIDNSGVENVHIEPNADIQVGKLSALQKAGFRLAIGVGAVITLVILVTLFQAIYIMFYPKTDSVLGSQTKFENVMRQNANSLNSTNDDDRNKAEEAIKQARENVNESLQNDSTWNRITSLFDLVVVKALLPIFTTILGYIFGSRVGGDDSQ